MKYLRKLSLCLTLICILAAAVVAEETGPPPCAPGETSTPPCVAQPLNDDSPVLGETAAPPAEPVVDVTDITNAVMWALSLF